jgi:hypothetical protein
MTSDARVDRYYYIYDSRERRALVLDRAGEEQTCEDSARARLIDHVRTKRSPAVLRRFARWCARQVDADECPSHTAAGRLWAAAQRDDRSIWQSVRRETTDTVMLAVALGLSRGQPDAARLLVVHACTHPGAKEAALDAAHMSERWAEFSAESDPVAAARALRGRHVDWFLDRLSTP